MNRYKTRDTESVRVPRRRNLVRATVNDLASPSPRTTTPTQAQAHPSREGRQSEHDGSSESGSGSDSSGEDDVSIYTWNVLVKFTLYTLVITNLLCIYKYL